MLRRFQNNMIKSSSVKIFGQTCGTVDIKMIQSVVNKGEFNYIILKIF